MLTGESRHYRFENLEFFAERGMVTLIDTKLAQDSSANEETYTWRIPPGQFMARAIAALVQEPDKYGDKLTRLRKLVEDAREVAKVAKSYGDPTDPSVLEHVIKHQRRNRIVMPHELPPMPGMAAPKYNLSGSTKSHDILTQGYQVTPDFSVSPSEAAAVTNKKLIV